MESVGTIAELSKNARKSAGTRNNVIFYSYDEVPMDGLKKSFKNT